MHSYNMFNMPERPLDPPDYTEYSSYEFAVDDTVRGLASDYGVSQQLAGYVLDFAVSRMDLNKPSPERKILRSMMIEEMELHSIVDLVSDGAAEHSQLLKDCHLNMVEGKDLQESSQHIGEIYHSIFIAQIDFRLSEMILDAETAFSQTAYWERGRFIRGDQYVR